MKFFKNERIKRSEYEVQTLLKGNKLLGFRSNKTWKMILSVLYLLFCAIILIYIIFEKRVGKITIYDFGIQKIFELILCFSFVTPYIFLSNTKFRDKVPLFRKHSFGASSCGIVLVLLIFMIGIGAVDSMHSPEYNADMLKHAYVEVSSKKATCEEDGEVKLQCEYCCISQTNHIDALGHDMIEVSRIEATKNAEGQVVKKCSRCGMTETEVLHKIEEKTEANRSNETRKSIEKSTSNKANKSNETSKPNETNKSNKTSKSTTEKKEISSVYSKLSDKQFCLLTEMIAKSFYSFTLSKEDYKTIDADSPTMNCLKRIYNYASNNYFELDPDYKVAFASKHKAVTSIPNYKVLEKNFKIEYCLDKKTGKWIFTINSYSLNRNDVVEYDNEQFIDAEGYLNKGVVVYWETEGRMEAVGEIKDIAYDKEIDNTLFVYALNVKFYDDPYSSGWMDGEVFLRANKNITGKPLYYINVLDKNRTIIKEEIDYTGSIIWKPLKNITPKSGTEVYMGAYKSKSFLFTIVAVDKENDIMFVKYPSGSTEYKSYSAIINSSYLYVK